MGGMTVIHIILMAPYIQTNNEELYLYNNQALTLAMCPLVFFFNASYAAIIFTGNRQNSEGNVNSYLFFVIYWPNVQRHA